MSTIISTPSNVPTPSTESPVTPVEQQHEQATRRFKFIILALVLVAAIMAIGFNMSGSQTSGAAVTSPVAVQEIVQQGAGDSLVSTIEKYFHYTNGHSVQLENHSVIMHFPVADTPDSETCGQLLADLGFDPSVNAILDNTNGYSGVQSADSPRYTAVWTYSSSKGLDITFTVKSAI